MLEAVIKAIKYAFDWQVIMRYIHTVDLWCCLFCVVAGRFV